ncbi:MAG: class B sortase [Acetatifactor sp.]
MNRLKKILSLVLGMMAAVCLLAAVVLILRRYTDDLHSKQVLESLRQSEDTPLQISSAAGASDTAEQTVETESGDNASEPSGASVPVPEPTPEPIENPYKDAFLRNADMAAWLQIPDTPVDYPVMWTPRDEEYYLQRGFDGKSDQNGCLILDTDSCVSPLTTNLIIHGHNMKSGAMFGSLMNYQDTDYYQNHREIRLYTPECLRNYEVIAVFYSQVYKKSDNVFKFYKFFQADTEEEFDYFYRNIKELSIYDTGVTAEFGDNFLTLSTCAYHVKNGRFVVVAKEVETGDTYYPIEK